MITESETQNNENDWERLIPLMASYCISLLGNPMPDYFTKIDNAIYSDPLNTIITVNNNLVSSSSVGANFSTLFEAAKFFMAFHRYFENSWEAVSERDGDYYIFLKDGVYATNNAPIRQGGQLFSHVIFKSGNLYNTVPQNSIVMF